MRNFYVYLRKIDNYKKLFIFQKIKNKMSGYLELIVGPMFSGKTTRLLDIYEKYKDTNSVLVINYADDTRYNDATPTSEENFASDSFASGSLALTNGSFALTHDKKKIPCISLHNISEIWKLNSDHPAEIILINEGQFFDDLVDCVLDMVENKNKRVYVCGLDGDFQRKKFGKILDLIPHCDKITKLTAKCHCGEPAIFSHRLINVKNQILIGSSDSYISVCRNCYS